MFLVIVSSRMSYLTSQLGQGRNSMWNTAASGVKWGASACGAGSPGLFGCSPGLRQGDAVYWASLTGCGWAGSMSAVKTEVRCRVPMVLATLLTFCKQVLFFKSFLGAEWKTSGGFRGAFLVTVCWIYVLDLKGPLAWPLVYNIEYWISCT